MAELHASTRPPVTRSTRRVLVTRPGEQCVSWVSALNAHGVDAVATPLIGIAEAPDPAAVDAVWAAIAEWQLLVFVSPNAVAQFFSRKPAGRDWPAGLYAAAPGPGTSAVLRSHGVVDQRVIEPAADAANFDSEALWQQLRRLPWQGARVLIVRGEGGRDWLATELRSAGAAVQHLAAYRRGPPFLSLPVCQLMEQALAAPERHLWFFSSSQALVHLSSSELLPSAALKEALGRSCALATHPRIAETASAAGFRTVLQSRPGLDDVVACIQSQASLDFSSASRIAQ